MAEFLRKVVWIFIQRKPECATAVLCLGCMIRSVCRVAALTPISQKLQKDTTAILFLVSQHEVSVVDKGYAP